MCFFTPKNLFLYFPGQKWKNKRKVFLTDQALLLISELENRDENVFLTPESIFRFPRLKIEKSKNIFFDP